MVFTCCVPRCRSNCLGQGKVSTFSFPTDTETKKRWIQVMCRKDFTPIKSSRVCELHFEPSQVLRETSAHDPRTGRILTAPLRVPRLRHGAVPTLFMPPPGTLIKTRPRKSPKTQERKRQKNQPKDDVIKEETGKTDEIQLATLSQMPCKCSVPDCRGNYDESNKVAVFGFPTNKFLREKWLQAIQRKDFNITKNSKVCERHFQESDVLRKTTFCIEETGEILSAPIKRPKLKEDAVPSIFPSCPSSSSSLQESPAEKQQKIKDDLGTEFQNFTENPVVIKEEIEESVVDPPQLVIGKVFAAEELSSPSISSSSMNPLSTGIPQPVPEYILPTANPDSASVNQASETQLSNVPVPKRKANDAELNANDTTTDTSHAKLCKCTKPSIPSRRNRKGKLHSLAESSKKSTGRSSLPIENCENATREIFQSLLDDSGNSPVFDSRTTERPGDLFDVFSDFIADKLREMDWDDCAYALRAILDVVFKAGKGRHNSKLTRYISRPNNSSGPSDQE